MNNKLKINILFNLSDNAAGGGNQFLKAIKNYFIDKGCYVDCYRDADVIIINSHHNLLLALKIKIFNSKIKFVHRIDGPICYYRDDGYELDKLIFFVNKILANGTIFQSQYTKYACISRGLNIEKKTCATILNAPDPIKFFAIKAKENKVNTRAGKKIRLIATSWSGNVKKGFEVYAWLDKHLNYDRYEMIFIGNSPVTFKNIIHKGPMSSDSLAMELRQADIFIFASKVESCSNSLLEAMHSGLPVVAFNGSSNPEIVKLGGELFTEPEQIPDLLEAIISNYEMYQGNIDLPSISDVGTSYYDFTNTTYTKFESGGSLGVGSLLVKCLCAIVMYVSWKIKQRFS